ncbi:hypothetical protein KFK09_002297 [Dendrobium nobile]|uniref:B-like cyclin n=1 Tax=Dendrobium nobile TaxID=94219 RepID=A0A8T3CBV9_DENNO|nr:hypothetical protein KFK09_002297 [Dendrobium nobile]
MVAPKGRAAGGFRILDESKTSKKERNIKGQGSERVRTESFASMAKPPRDALGRVSLPRKPMLVNASTKSIDQTDTQNDKGRMKNGRKALADIGNINSGRIQQCSNQLSYKPKILSWRDKFEGSKKPSLDKSNVSRGYGRFSLARGIMVADVSSTMSMRGNPKSSAQISGRLKLPTRRKTVGEARVSKDNQIEGPDIDSKVRKIHAGKLPQTRLVVGAQKVNKKASTTRKPAVSTAKLRRAVMARKTSITNKFETNGNSKNKELEELGTYNIHENSMVSQELASYSNGSNCMNDTASKTSISGFKSNRRKSYTLSLVVRRGCDSLMKNDLLANIDDITNPLEVVDYVDGIYQYYWTMEEERPSLANFMDIQSDITSKMRSILVNWLIEVHHKYQLMEESLFLMIELLDRLLSIVNIKKNELQLFGLATLLLASKYEDYWHPKVAELISLSINQYTKDEMLGMEMFILKKLKFRLNVPTPYVFMLRFLRAAESDKKLEDLAFYLIELCLVENESLKYKPSLLCASAIFVARSNLKLNPPWTRLLSKHSHYEKSQLRNCAEMILKFQKAACLKPVKYTYQKYLKPDRSCVASIKPINILP